MVQLGNTSRKKRERDTRWSPCLGRYPSPPSCITHTTQLLLFLLRDSWDPKLGVHNIIWSDLRWKPFRIILWRWDLPEVQLQSHLHHPSLPSHADDDLLQYTYQTVWQQSQVWCFGSILQYYSIYSHVGFPLTLRNLSWETQRHFFCNHLGICTIGLFQRIWKGSWETGRYMYRCSDVAVGT